MTENTVLLRIVGRNFPIHLYGFAGRLCYERLDERGKHNDNLLLKRHKTCYFQDRAHRLLKNDRTTLSQKPVRSFFCILKAKITVFTSVYAVLGAHLAKGKKGVKRFYIAASRYLTVPVAQV